MLDVTIDPTGLDKTVKVLKEDNKLIYDVMHDITTIVKEIDVTVFSSPERKKLDNELIPFLEKEERIVYTKINNCAVTISNALNKYLRTNAFLESESTKLNS